MCPPADELMDRFRANMAVAREMLALAEAEPCASVLFAEGRNAVQVQRWLGHHSPSFTLDTYVHLLDYDLGAPLESHHHRPELTPISGDRVALVA